MRPIRFRPTKAIAWAVAMAALASARPLAETPHPVSAPDATASAAHRARGIYLTYSLDYDEARAAFRQAIAANPDDPAGYRQLAAVNWLNLLFRSGAVLVDDYMGEVQQNVKRPPPPADLDAQFREAITRARALAAAQLRERPDDADAHFQMGATLGFVASYTATVEGRVLGGFRSARRAYEEHERVLELDSRRKDAGLIVGLYRYSISYLPVHWRLIARLIGFGSGRDRGLRMVEEAASYPADAQPEARFVLIVMYTREQRYADALRVIEQLQHAYPRNRLLWLEAGSTALRAGRPIDARGYLETGLSMLSVDPRPRAFGEEARWRLAYGTALAEAGDRDSARRELNAALGIAADDWVHDRVRFELRRLDARRAVRP